MKEFVENLISRLEEETYAWNDGYRNGIYGAIEIVKQLAEEYINCSTDTSTNTSSGWISCSEKLPAYIDNVLVCTENGGRTIAHLKHTPIEWRDMHMNKIDEVIAWMPLPEPYTPKEGRK